MGPGLNGLEGETRMADRLIEHLLRRAGFGGNSTELTTYSQLSYTQAVDRFIGMYVNDLTLDYGSEGRQAVRKLLQEAYKKKIIPEKVSLDFV